MPAGFFLWNRYHMCHLKDPPRQCSIANGDSPTPPRQKKSHSTEMSEVVSYKGSCDLWSSIFRMDAPSQHTGHSHSPACFSFHLNGVYFCV